MGNKANVPVSVKNREDNTAVQGSVILTKSSFDFLYVIGKGGFGKVNLVNTGLESKS